MSLSRHAGLSSTSLSGLSAGAGLSQFSGLSGVSWSPLALFAASEPGVWYDPSDLSTLFQDSAGTTPVTGLEQPVGLVLDKSKGLVLGSELVSNGTFDSATTGWTAQGGTLPTIDWVSGELRVTAAAASGADQIITTVAGRWYKVTGTIRRGTATDVRIRAVNGTVSGTTLAESATVTATSNTSVEFYFAATSTATSIYLRTNSSGAGQTGFFDNISVKEIAGNHASQSTSASRPVLSARYNQFTQSENLATAPWFALLQGTGATPTRTANAGIDPLGGNTATRLQFSRVGTTTTDRSTVYQSLTGMPSNTALTASVYLKSNTGGTQKVVLNPNFGNGTAVEVTLTTAWQQFSVTANTLAGTAARLDIGLGFATSSETSADILAWGADLRVTNDGVGLPAYQRVGAATAGSSTASGTADYDSGAEWPRYLRFDGTDDSLATSAIDFSATDKMSVFAGVRKLSDAAAGIVTELTVGGSTSGAFLLSVSTSTGDASRRTFGIGQEGASFEIVGGAGVFASPDTRVITGHWDRAQSTQSAEMRLRLNGVQQSLTFNNANLATGNFANAELYIGRRGGSTFPANMRLYSLIVRGAASTDGQIAAAEAWVNQKTKAY